VIAVFHASSLVEWALSAAFAVVIFGWLIVRGNSSRERQRRHDARQNIIEAPTVRPNATPDDYDKRL
jgi:hypothetical protein